jgi:hypothetical protein
MLYKVWSQCKRQGGTGPTPLGPAKPPPDPPDAAPGSRRTDLATSGSITAMGGIDRDVGKSSYMKPIVRYLFSKGFLLLDVYDRGARQTRGLVACW